MFSGGPRSCTGSLGAATLGIVDEHVLLVEDDQGIRDITARGLENSGFKVMPEGDGRLALMRFRDQPFDIVVLDLMLPSLGGLEVCRRIRETSQVPLIMLTARGETSDVVIGLEAGADDYVTKPFEIEELVARIRAVLRRGDPQAHTGKMQAGELEIDEPAFKAHKQGVELILSSTEFKLLAALVRNRGRVLTREILLSTVWDHDYLGDSRLVDMAIKRLRKKIEDDPSKPTLIQTVRGVGYRFEV
jgi:two-component system, OmpR family, response regulator MtrA